MSNPADRQFVDEIFLYFLYREPEASARTRYTAIAGHVLGKLKVALSVGFSKEARRNPAWFERLALLPIRIFSFQGRARLSKPVSTMLRVASEMKLSPFAGLSAPESDSKENGIWVGPRIVLPVCQIASGVIHIEGSVDQKLLNRSENPEGFYLEILCGGKTLHREVITHDGRFCINATVAPEAFSAENFWSIEASKHVVPQASGMSEDSRQLSWRVLKIEAGPVCLIDSGRSPATETIENLFPAVGINLVGYLTAELGVGEGARALARACVADAIPFSAVDVGYQSSHLQRDTAVLSSAVQKHFSVNLIYVNADQTERTANFLRSNHLEAQFNIGYWVWEQTKLPSSSLGAFAHVDEVWVPSSFAYHAIAPFSPVPVQIIPHSIQFSPSQNLDRKQFGLPEDKLLALVIYDFHSYQFRKNPQASLTAFRIAAAKKDHVGLVIKTINGQHHPEVLEELKNSLADLSNIFFIDEFLTRQQTWDLEACCDILISLHRAEGFGLALAEMMYLGKPVVATGWSANMDFMTTDNSFPIRYQLLPLKEAVGVYPAGPCWAEADVEHAATCLERLFDSPDLRHRIGEQAASDIRRQLDPGVVGALVRERLSLLGFWHPELRAGT